MVPEGGVHKSRGAIDVGRWSVKLTDHTFNHKCVAKRVN